MSSDDEMPNNLIATGALFAILHIAADTSPALTSVSLPEHGPGNQITVTFDFMNSPYRLMIERVRDHETEEVAHPR